MFKIIRIAAVFLAVFVMFFSCKYEDDTYIVYKDAQEESEDFVSESLLMYDSGILSDTLNVRFYEGNRCIPYVGIRYFMEKIENTIKEASYADSRYKYVVKADYADLRIPMVADVKNDTLTFSSFADLTNNSWNNDVFGKLLNYFRKYSGEKSRVFNLGKYGFKIFGGVDDAYIPLCLISNIFSCQLEDKIPVYNGDFLYRGTVSGEYFKKGWFIDGKTEAKAERSKELINLSYNLLCFVHDYLYGHPGYYAFADDGNGLPEESIVNEADKLTFDELLKKYAPETKEKLLSSSFREYSKGLDELCNSKVYGDGHSAFFTYNFFEDDDLMNSEESKKNTVINQVSEEINAARNAKKIGKTSAFSYIGDMSVFDENFEQHYIPAFELTDDGKTAIIRFDSFKGSDFWDGYYKKDSLTANPDPSSVNIADDTMGLFYKSFWALENEGDCSNVKNVILDVSCNGGGQGDCLIYILHYLINNPVFRLYDVISGGKSEVTSFADINLDGKYDANDKAKNYNYAVLTSFNSFSCGNGFPAICADNGIKIIGKRSGGGSCVVQMGCTADGFSYVYSGAMRISYDDWQSVESGAAVDKEISDYEDFFDNEKLSVIMQEVFGE